jgi:hypothetical protein
MQRTGLTLLCAVTSRGLWLSQPFHTDDYKAQHPLVCIAEQQSISRDSCHAAWQRPHFSRLHYQTPLGVCAA